MWEAPSAVPPAAALLTLIERATVLIPLLFALAFGPAPGLQVPSDTFGDPQVRELIERARQVRGSMADGLESFDADIWERVYIGVDARGFRRERGIVEEERAGRIRWTADGDRIVHWEAARREHPIVGWSSEELDKDEELDGFARGLTRGSIPPPLASFDPGSDRLFLGGPSDWFLHPLADSAGVHYRFESGDTLRIILPPDDRTLELVEARVLPREKDFRSLSASLWFDNETGALVRAIYRPARPFNLRLDVQDEDIPRLLPTVELEIPMISVDHSLHEFEWWIPQRFTFEGEARVGGLARFPVIVEWIVTGTEVNEAEPVDLIPDPLPEGWFVSTSEQPDSVAESPDVPPLRRVIVARSGRELRSGPGLREAGFRERVAFSAGEFEEFERQLRELAPAFGPTWEFDWGLADGLTRYNRVEGLATGVRGRLNLPGRGVLGGEARIGVAGPVLTAELQYRPRSPGWLPELGAYHRLVPSADFDSPHSLSTSVNTFVMGGGPNPFHFASGVEAMRGWSRPGREVDLRLFAEWHSSAERGTHVHVRRWLSDERTLPEVLAADEGFVGGLVVSHRWQSGLTSDGPLFTTRSSLELGAGDFGYGRLRGSAAASTPLVGGFGVAAEVSGGRGFGDVPAQRLFFPGGADGYRGGRPGDRAGEGFVVLRSELGRGFTGARLVGFVDWLRVWDTPVDPPPPLLPPFEDGWEVAAGGGVSFLDGLVRLEMVRTLRPEGGWRFLSYFDAIF